MFLINKFYMAARHISEAVGKGRNADCTRVSLEAAITEAKHYLHENPGTDCVAIVQIIKLVRRDRPPIIVEDVE